MRRFDEYVGEWRNPSLVEYNPDEEFFEEYGPGRCIESDEQWRARRMESIITEFLKGNKGKINDK